MIWGLERIGSLGSGRWIPLVLGALLLTTGCSSQPDFPSTGSHHRGAVVKSWASWDSCLRGRGVRVPVGYEPYSASGGPSSAPKLRMTSAQEQACQQYMPAAPLLPAKVRREFAAQAQCMTRHGFPNHVAFGPGSMNITYDGHEGPVTPGFVAAERACGIPVSPG